MTVPESGDERASRLEDERASRLHSALAMEDLIAANNSSNRTMLSLVEQVRMETEARDRKVAVLEKNTRQAHRLTYLVGAAMVVLLILAVSNAFNLSSARRQQEQVQQLNALLLDCVNSTGSCGRVNTLNQTAVLDEVKKYNLIGFYCIRTNPGTEDLSGAKFLKCMERMYPGGPTLSGS